MIPQCLIILLCIVEGTIQVGIYQTMVTLASTNNRLKHIVISDQHIAKNTIYYPTKVTRRQDHQKNRQIVWGFNLISGENVFKKLLAWNS